MAALYALYFVMWFSLTFTGLIMSLICYSMPLQYREEDNRKQELRKRLKLAILIPPFWPLAILSLLVTIVIFMLGCSDKIWPWEYDFKKAVRELVKEDK